MTEKIILQKEPKNKASQPVFIDIDLHAQLLGLKEETGIPIKRLVEKFINHGIQNVVIEEE